MVGGLNQAARVTATEHLGELVLYPGGVAHRVLDGHLGILVPAPGLLNQHVVEELQRLGQLVGIHHADGARGGDRVQELLVSVEITGPLVGQRVHAAEDVDKGAGVEHRPGQAQHALDRLPAEHGLVMLEVAFTLDQGALELEHAAGAVAGAVGGREEQLAGDQAVQQVPPIRRTAKQDALRLERVGAALAVADDAPRGIARFDGLDDAGGVVLQGADSGRGRAHHANAALLLQALEGLLQFTAVGALGDHPHAAHDGEAVAAWLRVDEQAVEGIRQHGPAVVLAPVEGARDRVGEVLLTGEAVPAALQLEPATIIFPIFLVTTHHAEHGEGLFIAAPEGPEPGQLKRPGLLLEQPGAGAEGHAVALSGAGTRTTPALFFEGALAAQFVRPGHAFLGPLLQLLQTRLEHDGWGQGVTFHLEVLLHRQQGSGLFYDLIRHIAQRLVVTLRGHAAASHVVPLDRDIQPQLCL